MKKILLILFLLFSHCFASETVKLKPDTDYLYFSDSRIQNVAVSDTKVITFEPVYTYSGEILQILFSALKEGNTNVEIKTDKETLSYGIEVVSGCNTLNDEFSEFDIPEVKPDDKFREYAEKLSNEELYSELLKKSPELAEKIHPNNKRKIIRALEIANSGAKLKSKDSPYDILWLRLDSKNRQFLYDNAEKRVDKMFKTGLFDECKFLFGKYGENSVLLNTIGIKELYPYINEKEPPEIAADEIKKNTRHYIKRQISWFNRDKDSNILYIDDGSDIRKDAFDLIENFLSK